MLMYYLQVQRSEQILTIHEWGNDRFMLPHTGNGGTGRAVPEIDHKRVVANICGGYDPE